jgi:hypothetical protein
MVTVKVLRSGESSICWVSAETPPGPSFGHPVNEVKIVKPRKRQGEVVWCLGLVRQESSASAQAMMGQSSSIPGDMRVSLLIHPKAPNNMGLKPGLPL